MKRRRICNRKHVTTALALAAIAAISTQAAAQDGGDPQGQDSDTPKTVTNLDQVTVVGSRQPFKPVDTGVGTKIPMDVVDTPQSITIVSRELMDMITPQNVGEVATLAPGVRNGERDVSTIFDVTARGFPVTYSRGFRINTMPFTNNGILIDFDTVDRVEIVRGPSSIIYGQADYGTTINTALKRPRAKQSTETAFTIGSYDFYKAYTDVTGPLNEDGSVRGRAVVSYEDRNSQTDYVGRDLPSVYTALDWDLSENTFLELTAFYNKSHLVTNYGFSLTDDNQLPDVPRAFFQGHNKNGVDLTTAFFMASLTHHFNNRWNLKAMASYAENDVNARESYISGRVNNDPNSPLYGTAPFYDFYVNDYLETAAADLTLTGEFDFLGRSHTLMLNSFYSSTPTRLICCYESEEQRFNVFDQKSPERYFDLNSPPPLSDASTYLYSEIGDSRELAVGGLLLLHPTDRLTVMTGARWTQIETHHDDLFTGVRNRALKDNAITPRLGVVYDLTDNLNLYGSYSEGVIFQTARTEDGSLLGPEEGVQWEFGTKGNIADDRLFYGVSVFRIERSNVAVGLPPPNPEGFVRGIGGQIHEGVELELMGEPLPGWNLFGSYSYLKVEVSESANPNEVGKQRANSPRGQFKLYSNYEIKDGPLRGLTFGGGLMYFSSRMIDNIGSYRFDPYTRMDLSLSYRLSDHIQLSLSGINILDEKIVNSISGTSGSANGGIIYQDPRMYYAKIAFRY